MAQIGYNTITITDNTDIERIYMQYCRSTDNQLTNNEVAHQTVTWQDTTPAWVNGQYIWSRSVVKYYGVTNLTYGVPVCITGAQGQTGGTGAAGRSLTSTVTQYTTAINSATINESTMNNYTWNNNVPTYSSSTPAYWVRVTNTYSNPSSTEYIIYKDNGLTDAIKTSHDANTTAQSADSKADQAISDASSALTQANNTNTALNNYKTANDTAVNALKAQATHYWWDSEGAHVASGVSPMASDNLTQGSPSTYGFNALMAPGSLALRQKNINLAQLATNALTFYIPPNSSTTQGPKALEVGTSGLKMYNPVANNNVELMSLSTGAITFKDVNGNVQATFGANGAIQSGNYVRGTVGTRFSSSGTKIDLINGEILTPNFRLSQGAESGVSTGAYIQGTIEALDGKIGGSNSNYWYIGNYVDYNQNQSAAIKSYGTAFIQLGNSNTWRIATNRFHSAWNDDSSGTSGQLHYPVYDSKYWDSGLHLPTSSTDKFLYIRNAPNTQTLENLQNDLEDSGYDYWTYRFYISADGSLYARNLYVLDDNGNTTQIGGTDGVYLLKSGGTITGNLTVNGTITGNLTGNVTGNVTGSAGKLSNTSKIGDTNKPVYFTANGVPTAISYEINKTVPSNAIFTDANVTQTATTTNSVYELLFSGTADNTTRTEGTRKTSTLTYNPSTKALVTGGTVNGYTLAAASAKGVDTSMTASSTSTNLPTTKAVADLIKTYLSLSGGTVSGETIFNDAVSVNDEFDADSITAGNLIVTGVGRFTNGIYGDLTGNVTGNVSGTAGAVAWANVTGKPNIVNTVTTTAGAHTAISSKTGAVSFNVPTKTSHLTNDSGFVTSSGVTSVAASGSGGITISGSPITTTGTITVGLNLSTAINGLTTGTSNANREDYVVVQYAGGGTTTTSYHRRPLKLLFAALNSSDITTALGFTPYNSTNPNGYTSNIGTVTSVRVQATSPLQSSTSTEQSSTLNTTISFANQNKNLVLAGPSSGNAAAPTFRNLIADDIPNIGWTKITSGKPTTSSGYGITDAIVDIGSNDDGQLVLTFSNNTTDTRTVSITATQQSSVAKAEALNTNGSKVGDTNKPVYFNTSGKPVAISYEINKTVPANAVFTDTWTPMTGATSSANGTVGYVNATPPKDGYNTKFLRADGTWVVPGGTYSLPLAANGTRGGVQIGYTQSGKNYPVQLSFEKMYVNVPWTDTTYSAGTGLSLSGTTFNHSNSITAGTAGTSSATSSTNRTISVPYVTYDAQGHITGSGTHTHTIDTYPEAYLSWGGKNFSASYGPIDAAMIGQLGANRFAFLKAAGLVIEYSTDGGTNWIDYGATDVQKTGLFARGQSFSLGKHTTNGSSTLNDQLRVTISTSPAELYTTLNKIAIYMSTAGNTVQVKIEKALESTPTTYITHLDWTGISGWSGWNILNIGGLTTYGNTAASQYGRIRFIFKQTAINSGSYPAANISQIMGFGGVGWNIPSNMARDGHLYSYDNSQNATFPAQVTATQFNGPLNGNATSATSSKYLINRGATTVTVADSSWAPSFTPSGHTMREKVWHQKWTQSGITYTPSGGSATSNTDSADLLYWLSSSDTANTLQVNMAIDGLIYAMGGFKGSLNGNASTATKWASAQTVYVTLGTASTTTTLQGGSSSAQTIGVNGTLGVGNGGTGATSFTANSLIMSGNTTTAALTTRGIRNNTTKSSLGWTSTSADIVIPTVNTIAYWNGAYDTNNSSNLTYCVKGAFGTATTKDSTTSVASGGTGLPTAGAVYTAIRAASDAYVTLAANSPQTIQSVKTFSAGAIFGTHWNISEDSTTNALVFKYTA